MIFKMLKVFITQWCDRKNIRKPPNIRRKMPHSWYFSCNYYVLCYHDVDHYWYDYWLLIIDYWWSTNAVRWWNLGCWFGFWLAWSPVVMHSPKLQTNNQHWKLWHFRFCDLLVSSVYQKDVSRRCSQPCEHKWCVPLTQFLARKRPVKHGQSWSPVPAENPGRFRRIHSSCMINATLVIFVVESFRWTFILVTSDDRNR